MPKQRVFTIVSDIHDGSEKELHALLDFPDGPDFAKLEMLHFACFVILDRETLNDSASTSEGTPSKLVFECNIDGSIDGYLDQLVNDAAIDRIYRHCRGYPVEGDKDARYGYLKARVRRPHLYHIGAPYRTARSIKRDRELRQKLDASLEEAMAPWLTNSLVTTASGAHEHWTWDVVKPWIAWLLGLVAPLVALWLAILTRESALPRLTVVLLTLSYSALALLAAASAHKMWDTSYPDLRGRVRLWIPWAAAGIAGWALLWWVRDQDRKWAVGLAAAFVALLGYNVYAAIRRRSDERLSAIRSNSAGPPFLSVWRALRSHALGTDERPPWWEPLLNRAQRLLNWAWWLVAYVTILVPIYLLTPYRWALVAALSALYLAKALWLSVLMGWPGDRDRDNQDFTRIVMFIAGVPAGAFAALVLLTHVHCPPELLALIVLVSVFSLWAVPLPSPAVSFVSVGGDELRALKDQEDRDVQNHMAAVVVLKQDHSFRVPVLRSFLWLLNRLFYRSWLPDLYRGKLFGIGTIHFCQWVVLDKRNYLFLSNYDDSWSSYLDDFGIRLRTGIQKVWGQGLHNPGTKDLERFKGYVRTTMVPHSLWYPAYHGLTVRQVWNNDRIRRGLATAKGEEAMVHTLRRLANAPKIVADAFHARVN